MDADLLFQTSLLEEKLGKLEITHIPGPHVICETLPKCVCIITGKKDEFFKKLDKAQAFYPDVPRCGGSEHTYDRNRCKCNLLCDHYRNKDLEHIIENMINV